MKFPLFSSLTGVLVFSALAAAQPVFTRIGDLPGGAFSSNANAISLDGRVVVGDSLVGSGQGNAIKFVDGVLTSLGDLPGGGVAGIANAVNLDGSIIAGEGNGTNGTEAALWASSNTPIGLGGTVAGGFFGSGVYGASANGSILVGVYSQGGFNYGACKWVSRSLVPLATGGAAGVARVDFAYGISSDGSTIVGVAEMSNTDYRAMMVRGTTLTVLDDLPGGAVDGQANGANADGSIIVGYGNIAGPSGVGTRQAACRWVNGTVQSLGSIAGQSFSIATACSADGNTVVGYAGTGTTTVATIWTPNTGTRNLKDVLTSEYGLSASIGTYQLTRVTGISADGTAMCGTGKNADGTVEGWVVRLASAPVTCYADFNQDGGVDGTDVEAFFVAFSAGDSSADTNEDGGVDGQDVERFFVQWAAGGC